MHADMRLGSSFVKPKIDHDFVTVARACGYRQAASRGDLAGFAAALTAEGPVFVDMRIAPGSREKLGRPTIKPHEVARRFRGFVTGG